MFIIAGEIRMQPGTRNQFLDAVAPMVAASRAEAGCHAYAFSPDVEDADLIRLWELWADADSLATHAASEHMAAWKPTRAALPVVSSDLRKYTVTDAVPLG